jgi:hypothetical protein
VKAINLLRTEELLIRQRIVFTLGLFCGHMKSARMVESFAWQMGVDPNEIEAIDYRLKNPDRPASWYVAELALRDGRRVKQDWWHLVDGDWGSGFFQNSACDFCDDVVAETADISFGDAWIDPYSSDGRGTNVVVVRSPVLHRLVAAGIEDGRLALKPVDAAFVEQTQAAGLRHRREGLSYRLANSGRGLRPRNRAFPGTPSLSLRRRFIYRTRRHIAHWSHRIFWLARFIGRPSLYIIWARTVVAVYHALAYSRGWLGQIVDRLPIGRYQARDRRTGTK